MPVSSTIPVRVVDGPSFKEDGFSHEAQPVKIVTGTTTSMGGRARDVIRVNVVTAHYGEDELGNLKPAIPVYVVTKDLVDNSGGFPVEPWPVIAVDGAWPEAE